MTGGPIHVEPTLLLSRSYSRPEALISDIWTEIFSHIELQEKDTFASLSLVNHSLQRLGQSKLFQDMTFNRGKPVAFQNHLISGDERAVDLALSIHKVSFRDYRVKILRFMPNIRQLCLDNVDLKTKELRVVFSLSMLDELNLDTVSFEGKAKSLPSNLGTLRLQRLNIFEGTGASDYYLHLFSYFNFERLSELWLHSLAPPAVNLYLAAAQKVQLLKMSIYDYHAIDILPSFPTMTSLQVLYLETRGNGSSWISQVSISHKALPALEILHCQTSGAHHFQEYSSFLIALYMWDQGFSQSIPRFNALRSVQLELTSLDGLNFVNIFPKVRKLVVRHFYGEGDVISITRGYIENQAPISSVSTFVITSLHNDNSNDMVVDDDDAAKMVDIFPNLSTFIFQVDGLKKVGWKRSIAADEEEWQRLLTDELPYAGREFPYSFS